VRQFNTIEEVFNSIQVEFRPQKAKGERAIFQLNLSGADNGIYWIKVEEESCLGGKGEAPTNPDVILSIDAEDWLKIINAEINPVTAYLQGKLNVRGNRKLALKLQGWFVD
jgi:putative sterol carrier protein